MSTSRLSIVILVGVLGLLGGCTTAIRATEDFATDKPWANYRQVEVQTTNGSVEIVPAAGDKVRIHGRKQVSGATLDEAQKNLERVAVVVERHPEHADVLRVQVQYPPELKHRNVGAALTIELPLPAKDAPGVGCDAHVRTDNGQIKVQRLVGELVLITSNGGINVSDIHGPVHASTSNGSVELQHVTGDIQAETSNGHVAARDVIGPCKLITSNGGVEYVAVPAVQGTSRVELRSTNGSIHATLPKALAADLTFGTTNGRVDPQLGDATLQKVAAQRTSYRAQMNGGGVPVIAETSNGNITVTVH
jgi:DUF4097 and DUF4098 domain-containing protein YvlB